MKYRTLVFPFIVRFGLSAAIAQAPLSFEWECRLGVPASGSLHIASTVVHGERLYFTGNYAGEELSFGEMAWRNSGGRDYITGCLSLADGRPLWLRTAYGPANESGGRILVGSDGNLLVFGHYTGQHIVFDEDHRLGNFDPRKTRTALHGNSFGFYAVYSPDGVLLDARSGSLVRYPDQREVAPLRDPAGSTYSVRGVRPGDPVLLEDGSRWKSGGGSDVLLVKREPSGKVAWVRQFGGTQDDGAVLLDDAQYPTLAFTYRSSAIVLPDGRRLTNPHPGYEGVGLIRLTAQGTVEWVADLPFEGDASVVAGTVETDGSVYLAGNTGTIPDGFVVKVTPEGQVAWKSRFGGPGHDYLRTICQTDSLLLAVGAFKSSRWYSGAGTAKPRPRTSGKDLFIAMINPVDGTTSGFLQLGGETPASGTLLPVPDGFVLQHYGPPGCRFARLPAQVFRERSNGHFSFTPLEGHPYERAGTLVVAPDYSHLTESSEPKPDRSGQSPVSPPASDSSPAVSEQEDGALEPVGTEDSPRASKRGNESGTSPGFDKQVIDAVEQQLDESLDKVKGKIRKLKNIIGKGG